MTLVYQSLSAGAETAEWHMGTLSMQETHIRPSHAESDF